MKEFLISCLQSTPFFPWVILTLSFFVIEEFVQPPTAEPSTVANRLLNCACGLVVCATALALKPLLYTELSFVTRHFGQGLISIKAFPDNPALTLGLAVGAFLIVQDFCFYLWHRLQHNVRMLWHIHAVHHSERSLNSTSYMRQSWIDGLVQLLCVNVPCVLILNVSLEAQYDAYLIAAAWNFFGHSNLRLQLGFMTPVLTGPQLHRLHHSLLAKHQDKNFAQFFPFWDLLFGTYVPPERHEFPPTGLHQETRIESLRLMVSWPFRQWLRHFTRQARENA